MLEPERVPGPVGNWDIWLAGSAIQCLCSPTLGEEGLRVCAEVIKEAELVRRIHARNSRTQMVGYGPLLSPAAHRHLMLFRDAGLGAGFSQIDNLEDMVAETIIDVFRLVQLSQPMEPEKRNLVLRFLAEIRQRA